MSWITDGRPSWAAWPENFTSVSIETRVPPLSVAVSNASTTASAFPLPRLSRPRVRAWGRRIGARFSRPPVADSLSPPFRCLTVFRGRPYNPYSAVRNRNSRRCGRPQRFFRLLPFCRSRGK